MKLISQLGLHLEKNFTLCGSVFETLQRCFRGKQGISQSSFPSILATGFGIRKPMATTADGPFVLSTVVPGNRCLELRRIGREGFSEGFRTIQQCSRKGIGFCQAECTTEDTFYQYFKNATYYAAVDVARGIPVIFLLLSDCIYYRGPDGVVAEQVFVVREGERERGLGHLALRWCFYLAREAGYRAMYLETFDTNAQVISMVERSGFPYQHIVTFPVPVPLANGTLARSQLFYWDLRSISSVDTDWDPSFAPSDGQ